MKLKTFKTLQELTGRESGAVQYKDNAIWIGNWTSVEGIPRTVFGCWTVGLGETMTAKTTAVPEDVKRAMQQHERDNGSPVSQTGFKAWRVNDKVTVVIQTGWN